MNGYILESKKILDSPIWSKPPLYFKVWHFLLIKAQFQEYDGLQRGQVRTSIPEIQEAMSFKVGYRKVVPSYDEVRDVIKFLKGESNPKTETTTNTAMITTTKTTRGFIATICNYNKYQDFKFYESHNESHYDNRNDNRNEPTNDKERIKNKDRNNKNYYYSSKVNNVSIPKGMRVCDYMNNDDIPLENFPKDFEPVDTVKPVGMSVKEIDKILKDDPDYQAWKEEERKRGRKKW